MLCDTLFIRWSVKIFKKPCSDFYPSYANTRGCIVCIKTESESNEYHHWPATKYTLHAVLLTGKYRGWLHWVTDELRMLRDVMKPAWFRPYSCSAHHTYNNFRFLFFRNYPTLVQVTKGESLGIATAGFYRSDAIPVVQPNWKNERNIEIIPTFNSKSLIL